jgi:uncharacterized protein
MLEKIKTELLNTGELYLRIKARPKSGKTEFLEIMSDGTLKIAIIAPAEKGKANKELTRFLAHEFGTKKEKVVILSGAGDRVKLVKITK